MSILEHSIPRNEHSPIRFTDLVLGCCGMLLASCEDMMTALLQDFRYAFRMMIRRPSITAVLILILALGIGANAAIFSLVDVILLRPFPLPNKSELFRIFSSDEQAQDLSTSSYPVFTDYRDQAHSFAGIAAYSDGNSLDVSIAGQKPERVEGGLVSGNYFELLGVRPVIGRLFASADDRIPGGHPVTVLSYRFWKKKFNGRSDAIGSSVRINDQTYAVIGVAPREFFGVGLQDLPQLWLPMAMAPQASPMFPDLLSERRMIWLNMVTRLKPDTSMGQAQTELREIARLRAAGQPSGEKDASATLVRLRDAAVQWDLTPVAPRIARLLFAVAAMVLLIACVVAAGLFLVRTEQRQREITVRVAIGASKGRVVRQLLAESFLIACISGLAGITMASWVKDILIASVPPTFPIPLEAATPFFHSRMLAFNVTCVVLVTFVFGLAPALHASRFALADSLKGKLLTVNLSSQRFTLRNLFVMVQVALAVLLLAGAGLLLRTLWNASKVNPGFSPDHSLLASLDLSKHGYNRVSGAVFMDELLQKLKGSPGIRSVSLAKVVPVQDSGMRISFETDGHKPSSREDGHADFNIVSPDFFRTMGISLLQGREFFPSDTASSETVAIVNRSFSELIWPGQSPVGKILKDFGPEGQNCRIIGMVADIRYRDLRLPANPMVYVPFAQSYMSNMTLLLRTTGNAATAASVLTKAVESLNKDLPLFGIQTLQDKLRVSLSQERMVAVLLVSFAVLALILSTAGLYTVISYSTQLRTREFGIRIAVGAVRDDLLKLILQQGVFLALCGIAIGTIVALALGRVIESFLFGVSPADPWTYGGMIALLLTASVAASLFPAMKAAAISPIEALRYE